MLKRAVNSVFPCRRVDISDTLMCVYELLGPEMLCRLYDKLGLLLTDTSHSSSWQVSVSEKDILIGAEPKDVRV